LQVGDTGPVESARRSNSRVLGSPFSGLSGHHLSRYSFLNMFFGGLECVGHSFAYIAHFVYF
jgi:hypothetical protein